jgi:outer membrane lipoprotein-sorting protein
MKKYFAFLFATVMLFSLNLKAQDLDEILESHYEVMGMDKVLKTKTIIANGKAVQMGMEFPMTLYQKRPGMVRMEAEIQGTKLVQAYDGTNGWMIAPWTGSMEPQDMSEDQVKGMKQMGDMDGDLYNWNDKGFKVSFEGEDEMEGTPVYKIRLEKEDGDVFTYYLDAENYVILKVDSKVMVQGAEVESSSFYSNFKPVEGMIMPFNIESRVNDQVQMQIVIDSFEVDAEIDDSMFSKPEASEE